MAANEAAPLLGGIPKELKALDQWVARRGKVPVDPKNGHNARPNDPGTWGTFARAVERAKKDGLDGAGFVFSKDDPYCGADLDKCHDPDTGEVEEWAREVVERLDSYTEVSPSGTGLHVFIRGSIPKGGPKRLPDGRSVEVYDRGRFFTVTGRHLPGTPGTIEERQEVLDASHHPTQKPLSLVRLGTAGATAPSLPVLHLLPATGSVILHP